MGSYQILGRSAKVQDAFDVRIFNKKKCSAYNDDRRRMQCLFLKEQV